MDDGFYDHPKVDDLPLAAVGLWTLAGAYCMRQLTDGAITESRVRKFGGTDEDIAALIDSELWSKNANGYQFKDWADWQLTREQIEEKREKDRLRKQKQRRDSDGTYTATPPGVTTSVPLGHREDSQEDSGRSHTVQSNPIQSPMPSPEPKGGKQGKQASKLPDIPLPDDWAPTPEHEAKARDLNVDTHREAEAFKAHALAHDRHAKRWNSAFTQWLLKAKPTPRGVTPLPVNGARQLEEWELRG